MKNTILHSSLSYFKESSFLRIGKNLKIGILGGSFNPAHDGHLHISNQAIQKLNLDLVIWMITPISPFKTNQTNIIPLNIRKQIAYKTLNNHPKIRISTFEESFNQTYTYLTLAAIQKFNKNSHDIYFIMGEDNLYNFHKFKNWEQILKNHKIAIFARGKNRKLPKQNLSSLYWKRNCPYYINNNFNKIDKTRNEDKNGISYFLTPTNNMSSTEIRKRNNKE